MDAEVQQEQSSDAKVQQAQSSGTEVQQVQSSDAEVHQEQSSNAEIQQAQSLDAEVQQEQLSDVEVQQAQPSGVEVQQAQSSDAKVQQEQSSDAEVQQVQSSMLQPLSTPRQSVLCEPRRLVPISSISPLPVCQKETTVGKRRARGETVVLTSSPYKARLQGTKSENRNKNDCKKTEKRKEDKNVRNVPPPKIRKKAVVRADRSRRPRPISLPRAPKSVKKDMQTVSEADDETECGGCGELYCESSEDWLACVSCKSWYEISCAGMLGKPKCQQDSFHRPQCE